jgi:hypothetical protein
MRTLKKLVSLLFSQLKKRNSWGYTYIGNFGQMTTAGNLIAGF